jgi:hypothetical protein
MKRAARSRPFFHAPSSFVRHRLLCTVVLDAATSALGSEMEATPYCAGPGD